MAIGRNTNADFLAPARQQVCLDARELRYYATLRIVEHRIGYRLTS